MFNWETTILVAEYHLWGIIRIRAWRCNHVRKKNKVMGEGPKTIATWTSNLANSGLWEIWLITYHVFLFSITGNPHHCTSCQALHDWGTRRVRFSVFLRKSAATPRQTELTAGPRLCVARATVVHCAAGRWGDDGRGGSSTLGMCFPLLF